MTLFRRLFLAFTLLVAAPVLAAGETDWFYKGTDIERDPAWTFGTLPNGLRYAIRRNALPEGQVSVRLRIDAGALHEADEEQGWAHFVEHMAFRGTAEFGDGEARETWQRLGASFGSDTNASTSAGATVYQLDLPHADEASLDKSLHLIAEMADRATFDPKIVETERGVVLSERRRRSELSTKMEEVAKPLLYAGLRYEKRNIIGTEATLGGATAEGLRAFYERWYRPDRAVLVMVGDADPKLMEALIAKRFSGWKPSGPAPAEPDYGKPAETATRSASLAYPGAPYSGTVAWLRPYTAEPPTKARVKKELTQALAERILNRRLEAKARGETAYLRAALGSDEGVNIADITTLSVVAKEGQWKEALSQAFAILRGGLDAPPSPTEISRELANWRASAVAAVQGETTIRSSSLAQRLIGAVDDNDVTSSPRVTLALIDELAPQMTPAAVAEATKALFAGSGPRLVFLSPTPVEGVDEALAAAEAARPAEREAERQVTMNDLPKFGHRRGREVKRERIADLDATIVRFANGSSLVFKRTTHEKGSVGVTLRFGNGIAGLSPEKQQPVWLASLVAPSGIGRLDQDALERLMTGRRMGLAFSVAEDSFELRGQTSAAELQDQLRLLAAKLAAPRWDRALFERFKASALAGYDLSFASATARAGREFPALSRSGDARWRPVEKEALAATSARDFQTFFAPLLAAGPIEAVIVGDVDLETAVRAMKETVGVLPARRSLPEPAGARAVQPPAPDPKPVTFTHKGDPSQSQAIIGWSTFGGYERLRERRALGLAVNMLRSRLYERLRDLAGRTYSPSASASSSEQFPAWGIVTAGAELRPEDHDEFFAMAREIMADLASKPAAADEFERARNPVVSGIERRLETNAYWLSTMEDWSRRPELIEQTRSLLPDYRSLTAEEVRAAVAAHVADAGDWSMLVLPARMSASVD